MIQDFLVVRLGENLSANAGDKGSHPLVLEDSTCHGAAKPVPQHTEPTPEPCAAALKPSDYALQQEKPLQ